MKEKDTYIKDVKDGKLLNMLTVIGENKDLLLYKYTPSLEYCIDMIANERIYLSPANEFNDPYDSLQAFKITDINEDDEQLLNAYREGVLFQKSVEQQKTVKIACFSENKGSSAMWGHYANKHEGYCLEYRVSDIVHKKTDLLLPVIYDKKRFIGGECEIPEFVDFMNQLRAIIHKEKAWEYEEEWRFIKHDSETTDLFIEKVKPKALYLGCRNKVFKDRAASDILYLCNNHELSLFKMTLSKNDYKLIPEIIQ